MAKSLVLLSFLIASSIALNSNAATNYNAVKKEVNSSREKINSYKKKIRSIEEKLQIKNEDYLQAMKSRQDLDYKIFEIEKNLNQSLYELEDDKTKVKKAIRHVALSYLENSTHEDLLKNQLLLKSLKKEKKEIQSKIEYCTKLKKKVFDLRTRLTETAKVERELYSVLRNLENEKNSTVKVFLTEKENHEKLKNEYGELKKSYLAKQRAKKERARRKAAKAKKGSKSSAATLAANFAIPLKKYISAENGSKGITYTVKSGEGVYATKEGTIEYVGSLANVGNVIMVAHGGDVRSIYLGDFAASVKKGQKVKLGSTLAKTRFSIKKGNLSKVYFEVRKKNTAQNTAQLINDKIKL
ncbi:murein hydrolase activator EnvC family protein [Halobacteriovorax sp. DPLXC-1]|uniref:murein hydrolase activator EnvC family protein n=1 Tax=Halobacteriovorax sp. DPLXC-1 TaxID=3110771 RepID=UPI002FF35AC9